MKIYPAKAMRQREIDGLHFRIQHQKITILSRGTGDTNETNDTSETTLLTDQAVSTAG